MLSGVGSSKEILSRLKDFTGFLSSFALCFLLFKRSCLERQGKHSCGIPRGRARAVLRAAHWESQGTMPVAAHLPQPLRCPPQPTTTTRPDHILACLFPWRPGCFFIFSVFDSELLLLLGCPSPVLLPHSPRSHLHFRDRRRFLIYGW